MSDVDGIDNGAHAKRLAAIAAAKSEAGGFRQLTDATAAARAVDPHVGRGNEILAWLAGNRMRILDNEDDLRPRSPVDASHADEILGGAKPDDPVEAARRRASVLSDLRREAARDPRVVAVFEADPIVAEDPSTGKLVTSRMLRARTDVFDAMLTMLGRPVLKRAARSWLAVRLSNAFPALTPAAQGEWMLSEMRHEEAKAFLDRRTHNDLKTLGEQLSTIIDAQDIWAAVRAFCIAAHIGVGDAEKSAHIADLLEMRDFPKKP